MGDVELPRLRTAAAEFSDTRQEEGSARFSFVSFGVRIGIQCNSPAALDELRTCLPPRWRPSSSRVDHVCTVHVVGAEPGGPYRLLADGEMQLETDDWKGILHYVENQVYLWVAEHAKKRVFVHAGVVERNGRALVLPGRSFAGKTTLVKALIRAGATYYSDEAAVLDEDGLVHPYPRRLGVREGAGGVPSRYTAGALGAKVGRGPVPIGTIVLSEFRDGAVWRPRRLSPGQAVLELLLNTVPARAQPDLALNVLSRVVEKTPVYQSLRPDTGAVVDALLGYLD